MFSFHAAFLLGLIALAAGTALYAWSNSRVGGESIGFAKWVGLIVIVLSTLSILCTVYYGVKYWKQGYKNTQNMTGMMQNGPVISTMSEEITIDRPDIHYSDSEDLNNLNNAKPVVKPTLNKTKLTSTSTNQTKSNANSNNKKITKTEKPKAIVKQVTATKKSNVAHSSNAKKTVTINNNTAKKVLSKKTESSET